MSPDSAFGILPRPDVSTPPSFRWFGDGLEIPPETLEPSDLEGLRVLYAALNRCYHQWLEERSSPDFEALSRQIQAFDEPPLNQILDGLGASTLRDADAPPLLRRAMHDLRGGAFFALRMYGVLLRDEAPVQELVQPAVLLARDQAKLVRTLIPSIDPEGYRKDREEKSHGMRELVDKWQSFRFPGDEDEAPVAVKVDARWRGDLAARCLEASALDRVLYNFLNNAARFTADREVHIQVEALTRTTIRIAVANAITPEHRAWLQDHAGEDARKLFMGGVTRGGEGVGLQAAAEIVARAWAQVEGEEALDSGTVGARVHGETFAAWLLWPAYLDPSEPTA